MRQWFATKLDITRGVMLTVTSTFVIAQAIIVAAVVVLIIGLGDAQRRAQQNARDNRAAIAELRDQNARLRRIERPTQQQLTQASLDALRAIRSCARSARCRRQNPGVTQVARSIPRGEIPRRAPRRRASTNSGGGTSPSSGGSNSPGTVQRPSGPTQTGRAPQPTTRPQTRPQAPANPPASTPARPPAASNPSTPGPRPPVTVPPVTTPPVSTPTVSVPPVTVPPITVPVPVRVCTPIITVNCRQPGGEIRSQTATVDPESNSGRGNQDDPLCDRLELPCDEDGRPVFPPGLIRFA